MKYLPVSDLPFKEIIREDLLYVDKTGYIFNLLKSRKKSCFLSRPRRFGKTLLLTLWRNYFWETSIFSGALRSQPWAISSPYTLSCGSI